MLWLKSYNIPVRLSEIERQLKEVFEDFKRIRDRLDSVEIKALESKKVYHRKLKNLFDKEEDTEKDKNTSVFLGPNGNPI